MKKFFLLSIIFGGLLGLSSCSMTGAERIQGSGNLDRETRTVQDIHGVELRTLGDLSITLGTSESLEIEAEDNFLPYIETSVKNGILIIQQSANVNLHPSLPVRYLLTVKNLDELRVLSSGNIQAPVLEADRVTLVVDSSGHINLDGLMAKQAEIEINSSGNIKAGEGQVREQTIIINSSGNYLAENMRSESAEVDIRSSGNATIWVTDTLDVNLSSSGNVNYYGNPEVSERTTSNGRSKSLGEK